MLLRAVEIGIVRNAGLLRRLDEDVAQGIGIGPLGDVERPVGAVEIVLQALVALGLLEEGEYVGMTPAGIAELAPAVVIVRLAADIDHGVDRARAAQRLAARPIHAPVFHRRLRRGVVKPVELRHGEPRDARRHADQQRLVRAAGLEQQHARRGIGGEPVGQHAARRAGADDDVVVSRFRHFALRPVDYSSSLCDYSRQSILPWPWLQFAADHRNDATIGLMTQVWVSGAM